MSGPAAKLRGARKGRKDWETPPWLFDLLHDEFSFDVDAAASPSNAKLPRFWTKEQNGLEQSWRGLRVFCNPPYGLNTGVWVEKAASELEAGCPLSALVLPANTESFWFHDFGLSKAAEVRFIRRRIHFLLGGRRVPNGRPVFASCVMVFRPRAEPWCAVSTLKAPNPKLLEHGRLINLNQLSLPAGGVHT